MSRALTKPKAAPPDLLKAEARAWLKEHGSEIMNMGMWLLLFGEKDRDEVKLKAWQILVDKFLPDLKEKVNEQATSRPIAIQINNVQRGKPQTVTATARVIPRIEAEAS